MQQAIWHDTEEWEGALTALGFSRGRSGHSFRSSGLWFTTDGRWCCLQTALRRSKFDPLACQPPVPGLWKLVAKGRRFRRVFELPLGVVRAAEADHLDGNGASPFRECMAWALATADGEAPADWRTPPRAELESWLPPGALTVVCGGLARQGALVDDPARLLLRFPIVSHVSPDLPESRLTWLRELLIDAQTQWRMVRIRAVSDSGERSVVAEADLTGAPHPLIEGLMATALAALGCVVSWVVASAAFVADATRECRALETCPARAWPAERR